ncbi:unnamed protein product, partial [Laminaria digitata]
GLPTNVAGTVFSGHKSDSVDGWVDNSDSSYGVVVGRKRSRSELDEEIPPQWLDHAPLKATREAIPRAVTPFPRMSKQPGESIKTELGLAVCIKPPCPDH